MRTILLAATLLTSPAYAQFSPPPSGGSGSPGGASGQLQYNNSGAFGGVTISGDGTLNTSTGVLTVSKTGGVSFSASATKDTTNASNITSGTLPAAQAPKTYRALCEVVWNTTTSVSADSWVCIAPQAATLTDFLAYTGGTSTPSFTVQISINGSTSACLSANISSSSVVTKTCTPTSISAGDKIGITTSSVSGTPNTAAILVRGQW